MKMTDVADVLERAADLYESEQIEWCQGNWNKEGYRLVPPGDGTHRHIRLYEGMPNIRLETVLSMCASGALAKACRIPVHVAQDVESFRGYIPIFGSNNGEDLYFLAREAVLKKLRGESDNPLRELNIPSWNDVKGRTKQEIIDVFKDTAKELRNGNQG